MCVTAVPVSKSEEFLLKARRLFTFFVDDDATVFTSTRRIFFDETQGIRLRRQVDVFSTTSDTNPACNKLSDEMVVWLSVCSDVQFVCTWSS